MLPGSVEALNNLYEEAVKVDKDIYSEMRSNILLVSGEHYTKNTLHNRNREREGLLSEQSRRLRITKNHTHRISRMYQEAILSKAPGVQVIPANQEQIQDQKDAEHNKAVIEHINRVHNMKSKIRDWIGQYVDIGEVATKIFWDPKKGNLMGYEQKLSPEGVPLFQAPDGNMTNLPSFMNPLTGEQVNFEPVPDKTLPVYEGDLCIEDVYGYNMWRSPGTNSIEESPYIGLRKMVSLKKLKYDFKDDPVKSKQLTETMDTDFIVFDSNIGSYEKKKDYALVKEIYYRPCAEMPEGYYYLWTQNCILGEGTLPFGIFPIVWKGFDKYPSAPRGRSIIKIARPYQAEINRSASQKATHGVTTGDDKILYQGGSKLVESAHLPGLRAISYSGETPIVMQGRPGEQFSKPIADEKHELFEAVMLAEEASSEQQNLDPYTLLFRTMSQQGKYKKYTEQFSDFLVESYSLILKIFKEYAEDDRLVRILGPREQVNIAEFRKKEALTYRVEVIPQESTIDTQLGKQLTMNHIMQYVGKQMEMGQIGLILRNMPFVNNEEVISELTIDYDNAKNDMLALERGEMPQMGPYDNNEYYVKKLTHRIKQADFRFLDPRVQQNYQNFMAAHQEAIAQKQAMIQEANKDEIPIGGALITVSMRVASSDGGSSTQVRLPYNSIMYLIKRLEQQGNTLENLENMNQGALAEIAGKQLNLDAEQAFNQENRMQLQQQGFTT